MTTALESIKYVTDFVNNLAFPIEALQKIGRESRNVNYKFRDARAIFGAPPWEILDARLLNGATKGK